MDGQAHDEATPQVQGRVRASFDRQGLMALLGAHLTHVGPGRVHIALPSRPEVTRDRRRSLVAARGQQTPIRVTAPPPGARP